MSRNEVLEMISEDMLSSVSSNPMYVQCLLHIKHYRDFHREEKQEFRERIEVIDHRYAKYAQMVDWIQILIIVLSAGSTFVQASSGIFKISDSTTQFISLCVSSWTALSLAIAKYYKLDEQKESMNNLRHQCAEIMGELGTREDRLNTLCSREIWASPNGLTKDGTPAMVAWENERDEMYNSLKQLIQKKQVLVNTFDKIMDSQESRKLVLRARKAALSYKNAKLEIDRESFEQDLTKKELDDKRNENFKPMKRTITQATKINKSELFGAMGRCGPSASPSPLVRNRRIPPPLQPNSIIAADPPYDGTRELPDRKRDDVIFNEILYRNDIDSMLQSRFNICDIYDIPEAADREAHQEVDTELARRERFLTTITHEERMRLEYFIAEQERNVAAYDAAATGPIRDQLSPIQEEGDEESSTYTPNHNEGDDKV
jgi:hypothetical protein